MTKNRIGNKIKGLGLTAFLLAAVIAGEGRQIPRVQAAAVESTGVSLTQKADWTDRDNFRAEVAMEISGLKAYAAKSGEPAGEIFGLSASGPACEDVENRDIENAGNPADVSTGNPAEENAENQTEENAENPADVSAENQEGENADNQTGENAGNPVGENADNQTDETAGNQGDGGEAAGGTESPWDGSAPESAQEESAPAGGNLSSAGEDPQIRLIYYVSEYFEADAQALPQGIQAEAVPVRGQEGGQTTVTRLVYPIDIAGMTEETIRVTVPIILREEYRISDEAVKYPVGQDEPLEKDCTGCGAAVVRENGGQTETLAQAASALLEVPAAEADFCLELTADTDRPKAGQSVTYELKITNTGDLPLADIRLAAAFSREGLTGEWEEAQGLETEGFGARLDMLERGGSRTLYLTVHTEEDQDGSLWNTVSAVAALPGAEQETMGREASLDITVQPLKVDFAVEKTADRTVAAPGDTVIYQICIRNTGERTLHSVVGTERFLSAGVRAQFVEKAGVVLNASRSQALISQIAPGEAFALEAEVTLPEDLRSQELLNQVTVVSKETGNRTVQSQAEITVQAPRPTAVPTQALTGQGFYQSGGGTKSSGSLAQAASSQPKTEDPLHPGFFTALLACASLTAAVVFCLRKAKRKH